MCLLLASLLAFLSLSLVSAIDGKFKVIELYAIILFPNALLLMLSRFAKSRSKISSVKELQTQNKAYSLRAQTFCVYFISWSSSGQVNLFWNILYQIQAYAALEKLINTNILRSLPKVFN